jgi:hypothetical protein
MPVWLDIDGVRGYRVADNRFYGGPDRSLYSTQPNTTFIGAAFTRPKGMNLPISIAAEQQSSVAVETNAACTTCRPVCEAARETATSTAELARLGNDFKCRSAGSGSDGTRSAGLGRGVRWCYPAPTIRRSLNDVLSRISYAHSEVHRHKADQRRDA